MTDSVRLDAESVEAIAVRVAELVAEQVPAGRAGGGLVGVDAVARHLGATHSWVYTHADELGVRRLGTGPRGRLRFDLAEVDRQVASCSASRESDAATDGVAAPVRRRRRPGGLGTGAPLLPIRGEDRA